jgi:small-conductance mechanosensitive channel
MIPISNQISELITPFIVALILLVISLWFKDFATKIAKGLSFSFNKSFQEGDKVILDGERALIVKVGLTQTVFGITKSDGEWEGDYVWRYVPNERIPYLKLEKVVEEHIKNGGC